GDALSHQIPGEDHQGHGKNRVEKGLHVRHSKGMAGYLALSKAIERVLLRKAEVPRRQVLPIPGGRFLVMPAADQEVALCKLVTVEASRREQ
ncbi:hypothetical protein ABTI46_20090, partial [Acinetobacter baumannii]